MNSLIDFLSAVLKQFFGGIWRSISNFFVGIFEMINIGDYLESLMVYKDGLTVLGWIVAVLTFLILIAVVVAIGFLIFFFILKLYTITLKYVILTVWNFTFIKRMSRS